MAAKLGGNGPLSAVALLMLTAPQRAVAVPAASSDGLLILDPNRGDTWMRGGSYSVLWTSMRDDIALCEAVEVSLVRGRRSVDSVRTENDGAHLFYVRSSTPEGSNYRVSVHCVEPPSLSAALSGTSDEFSIESNPATFVVERPTAGAVWPLGSDQEAVWSLARDVRGSDACKEVQVLLVRRASGPSGEEEIAKSVTVGDSEGSRSAIHLSGDLRPGNYLARVQCAGDTALGGESGAFQVTENRGALELSAPHQGSSCQVGHACRVEWSSNLQGRSKACETLSGSLADGKKELLAVEASNDSSGIDVYVPAGTPTTTRAHFELKCAGDPSIAAESKVFRLDEDPHSIRISEPHDSSLWATGMAHTVRWTSTVANGEHCATVSVDLLLPPAGATGSVSGPGGAAGAGAQATVVSTWPQVPNSHDAELEVYVPGATAPSSGYRVRVACDGDVGIAAVSDAFAVERDPTVLQVTAPRAQAKWSAGTVEMVEWTASEVLRTSASCAEVNLILQHDGGPLGAWHAQNHGKYAFYVNGSYAPGAGYSFVVECTSDRAVRAESPPFEIASLDEPFVIAAPGAASEWVAGQSYAVRWSSPLQLSDLCATVLVELVDTLPPSRRRGRPSRDSNGAAEVPAVSRVEATNTGEAWITVPRATDAGDRFAVRVSCSLDRALTSTSPPFPVRSSCSGSGCASTPRTKQVTTSRGGSGEGGRPDAGTPRLGDALSIPQVESPVPGAAGAAGASGVAHSAQAVGSAGTASSAAATAPAVASAAPVQPMPLVGMEDAPRLLPGTRLSRGAEESAAAGPCAAGGHVSAGLYHSCAITATGGLLCWGDSTEGQTEVPPGHSWLQVSAGVTHSCGITAQRRLLCWGGRHRWTPVTHHEAELPDGEMWERVSAGHSFSCAVSMSSRLACWGYDGEMSGDRPPRGLLWTDVSVGEAHACGITVDGAAVCWGENGNLQAQVPERRAWRRVSTRYRHTCGVTADGEMVCWGASEHGQTQPPTGYKWTDVSTGRSHSCGLTTNHLLRCWGHLTFGLSNAPPGYTWAEVSLGMYHACGLVQGDGDVLCWGMHYHAQTSVPEGYRYWSGCEALATVGAPGVASEHKAGKLACPLHEVLATGDSFRSRDAVEQRCGALDCASYGWSLQPGADEGKAWFCKRDYYDATDNGEQFPDWEVGRPVTKCAPRDGDIKLSSYPAGELLVFYGDKWGTVCRAGVDEERMVAAGVACRQLGYTHAVRTYEYVGSAHLTQAVQGVKCVGSESTLLECAPSSDGQALCSHEYGDVGIHCVGSPDMPRPTPCGSAHATHIREGVEEAQALLLHGAVATESEVPHSFDGRLRYTSGGFNSHGRMRMEPHPGQAAKLETPRCAVRNAALLVVFVALLATLAAWRRARLGIWPPAQSKSGDSTHTCGPGHVLL